MTFFSNDHVSIRSSICNSLIVCDGDVTVDSINYSIVVATGKVNVKYRDKNSIVIEDTHEPLGFLKLYDTLQAGIQVGEDLSVTKVVDGKPFAKFKEGDQVLSADGKKVASPDEFRRLVRRSVVTDKTVVFKVRRGGKELELTVALTDQ